MKGLGVRTEGRGLTNRLLPTKKIAPGVRLNTEGGEVPREPGTQAPTRWAMAAAALALLAAGGITAALPLAAGAAWMTWRGCRAPGYVALKRIRAARRRVEADLAAAESADEAVGSAAALAPGSWTVQREAAAYYAFRGEAAVALQHYAKALELWPGDRRALLLDASQLAMDHGQYTWVIDNVEPHAASLRPERSEVDARLLALLALARVGVDQPDAALDIVKRLPLHRRDLTPVLLLGLCVRAVARHATGQRAAAQGDLARVYAADPAFPFLKTAQELINEVSTA